MESSSDEHNSYHNRQRKKQRPKRLAAQRAKVFLNDNLDHWNEERALQKALEASLAEEAARISGKQTKRNTKNKTSIIEYNQFIEDTEDRYMKSDYSDNDKHGDINNHSDSEDNNSTTSTTGTYSNGSDVEMVMTNKHMKRDSTKSPKKKTKSKQMKNSSNQSMNDGQESKRKGQRRRSLKASTTAKTLKSNETKQNAVHNQKCKQKSLVDLFKRIKSNDTDDSSDDNDYDDVHHTIEQDVNNMNDDDEQQQQQQQPSDNEDKIKYLDDVHIRRTIAAQRKFAVNSIIYKFANHKLSPSTPVAPINHKSMTDENDNQSMSNEIDNFEFFPNKLINAEDFITWFCHCDLQDLFKSNQLIQFPRTYRFREIYPNTFKTGKYLHLNDGNDILSDAFSTSDLDNEYSDYDYGGNRPNGRRRYRRKNWKYSYENEITDSSDWSSDDSSNDDQSNDSKIKLKSIRDHQRLDRNAKPKVIVDFLSEDSLSSEPCDSNDDNDNDSSISDSSCSTNSINHNSDDQAVEMSKDDSKKIVPKSKQASKTLKRLRKNDDHSTNNDDLHERALKYYYFNDLKYRMNNIDSNYHQIKSKCIINQLNKQRNYLDHNNNQRKSPFNDNSNDLFKNPQPSSSSSSLSKAMYRKHQQSIRKQLNKPSLPSSSSSSSISSSSDSSSMHGFNENNGNRKQLITSQQIQPKSWQTLDMEQNNDICQTTTKSVGRSKKANQCNDGHEDSKKKQRIKSKKQQSEMDSPANHQQQQHFDIRTRASMRRTRQSELKHQNRMKSNFLHQQYDVHL